MEWARHCVEASQVVLRYDDGILPFHFPPENFVLFLWSRKPRERVNWDRDSTACLPPRLDSSSLSDEQIVIVVVVDVI